MNDWVTQRDYSEGIDTKDRPRPLDEAEIEYIVSHLPLAPSADPEAAEVNRKCIMDELAIEIEEGALCPGGIMDLVNEIVTGHYQSLIAPGTSVGITSAEAVGAQTTQMTLNTFHTSGSSRSANVSIEDIRDLIFARRVRKNETCTVYFTDKTLSFGDVLNMRRHIVGSVVSDFVRDYDIEASDAPEFQRWWHDTAPILLKKTIPASNWVMRLYLNTTEMYKQGVSIALLASVLERESPSSVVAIHGPIGDGIIDLYPKPELIDNTLASRDIGKLTPELAELTYLQTIVYPEFSSIRVKGIAGIRKLFPIVSPVWRMVALERKAKNSELPEAYATRYAGAAWWIFYNPDIMRMTGLQPGNLAALCQYAGLEIIGGTDTKILVGMPEDRYRSQNGSSVIKREGQFLRLIPADDLLVDGRKTFKKVTEDQILETDVGIFVEVDAKVWTQIPTKHYRLIEGQRYVQLNRTELITVDTNTYEILKTQLDVVDPFIQFNDEYYRNMHGIPMEPHFVKGKIYRPVDANAIALHKGTILILLGQNIWVPVDKSEIKIINDKYYKLVSEENFVIEDETAFEIVNLNIIKLNELKPGEYVQQRVSADKAKIRQEKVKISHERAEEARQLSEEAKKAFLRQQIVIPPTDLMLASEFVIAETDGSSLKELLSLPGIDRSLTTCNNMYVITETFGIEAARSFIVRELTNIIANTGGYVHPANAIFIAEFITSRGEPYGATFSGISRQKPGHLSLSSFERASKVFTQSSLHGRTEDIRNVSASVAVGSRMAIGSGSFDVGQDIVVEGEPKTVLNDDLFTALEQDDETLILQQEHALNISESGPGLEGGAAGNFTFDFAEGAEDATGFVPLATTEVQANVVQVVPKFVSKLAQPDVVEPTEMLDVLQQIKIGHIRIAPLQSEAEPGPSVRPIVSTGLVIPNVVLPAPTGGALPVDINDMLRTYVGDLVYSESDEEEEFDLEPRAPSMETIPLPSVEIDELPSLANFGTLRDTQEVQRERTTGLEPIDIGSLMKSLKQ